MWSKHRYEAIRRSLSQASEENFVMHALSSSFCASLLALIASTAVATTDTPYDPANFTPADFDAWMKETVQLQHPEAAPPAAAPAAPAAAPAAK